MYTTSKREGNEYFKYRVSAVVINGEHVLIHRAEIDDFWSLPGGHVMMMEDSMAALKREMKEEICVNVQVKRLLWVVENFFDHDSNRFHELCLYYLVEIPDSFGVMDAEVSFHGAEDTYGYLGKEIKLIFKWFTEDELDDIVLYPEFLSKGLKNLPEDTMHIICR